MVTSLGKIFQVDWGKEVRVLSKENFCRNSLLVLKSTPRGHGLVDFRPFRLKIWPRFWRSNVWTVYSRLNFPIVIMVPFKPNTCLRNVQPVASSFRPVQTRRSTYSSYDTKAEPDYRLIIYSKYFQAQIERHTSLKTFAHPRPSRKGCWL